MNEFNRPLWWQLGTIPLQWLDGAMVESLDFGPKGWGSIPALLHMSCVTLGQSRDLCGPPFPHPYNSDDDSVSISWGYSQD